MGRKVNIIKHLEMMGYTVIKCFNGDVQISLNTDNGNYVKATIPNVSLNDDYIIEKTVALINSHIVKEF